MKHEKSLFAVYNIRSCIALTYVLWMIALMQLDLPKAWCQNSSSSQNPSSSPASSSESNTNRNSANLNSNQTGHLFPGYKYHRIWLTEIIKMPIMDGLYRYPVRSVYVFKNDPRFSQEVLLTTSYYITYNVANLPERVYELEHHNHLAEEGRITRVFHFQYFAKRQTITEYDSLGNLITKKEIQIRRIRGAYRHPYVTFQEPITGNQSQPNRERSERSERSEMSEQSSFMQYSPVELTKTTTNKRNTVLEYTLFRYPSDRLEYEKFLYRTGQGYFPAHYEELDFWYNLVQPSFSFTYHRPPSSYQDYYRPSKTLEYYWHDRDNQKISNINLTPSMTSSWLQNQPVMESKRIFYYQKYPVRLFHYNHQQQLETQWLIEYHPTMPMPSREISQYYDNVIVPGASDQQNENLELPLNGIISELIGVDEPPSHGGLLLPWPRPSLLPNRMLERNSHGHIVTKIYFDYKPRKMPIRNKTKKKAAPKTQPALPAPTGGRGAQLQ